MKIFLVILAAVIIFSSVSCQKKFTFNFGKKPSNQSSDIYSETIKDEMSGTNTNNIQVNTNISMTEPVTNNNLTNLIPQESKSSLPIEPEVGVGQVKENNETNVISRKIEIKREKPELPKKQQPEKKTQKKSKPVKEKPVKKTSEIIQREIETPAVKSGVIILIGNDSVTPTAAPRKNLKMTFVITSKLKEAKYCDFFIYAMPAGKGKKTIEDYLIGEARNINIVNGQSQLTRIWNGMNTSDDFLPAGSYNIYIYYQIKNSNDEVLKKEGRYWGIPDKNVVTLK